MSRRKQARPIRHLDGDDDGVDGAEGQLGAELTPTVDGDGVDQATGTSSSSLLQLPLNMDDGDDSLPPRAATGECLFFFLLFLIFDQHMVVVAVVVVVVDRVQGPSLTRSHVCGLVSQSTGRRPFSSSSSSSWRRLLVCICVLVLHRGLASMTNDYFLSLYGWQAAVSFLPFKVPILARSLALNSLTSRLGE